MSKDWKPPPYSHELAAKLGSPYFGDDRKNSPLPVHPMCHAHICGKDADWWHPNLSDAYCEGHITINGREYFTKAWLTNRYQIVIKNLLKKEPKLRNALNLSSWPT